MAAIEDGLVPPLADLAVCIPTVSFRPPAIDVSVALDDDVVTIAGEDDVVLKPEDDVVDASPKFDLPCGVVQVLNTKTGMVHLSLNASGTFCNSWVCGSRDLPSMAAELAETSTRWLPGTSAHRFCLGCHSSKTLSKNGGALLLEGQVLEASSSSESESPCTDSASDFGGE